MAHVWGWWTQQRRIHGPHGPLPLTHAELEAWARLQGLRPTPWEVELIMRIDDVFLARMGELAKASIAQAKERGPRGR